MRTDRNSRLRIALAAILLCLAHGTSLAGGTDLRFDDRFSEDERRKLATWIDEVVAGVERLVGPFPFPVRVQFERTRSVEPVPWARTLRGRVQGIRFHVDPRHPLDDFRSDWTAPHEFSHLILPYLGSRHAWFAEGFASFMQYQVMHAMGVLDAKEAARRYRVRLDRAQRAYAWPGQTFVDAAPRLRAERKYPTLYWGGAVFFFRLEERLSAETSAGLIDVLREYLACCRRPRADLPELITALDELLGSDQCADALAAFASARGFPKYDDLAPGIADRQLRR